MEFIDKEKEKRMIFKNWNKETEKDLKSITELALYISGRNDFSRFIYTNKFILHGEGKVKLPKKHIEYLEIKDEVEIENINEITIDEMVVQKFDGKIDLSQFTINENVTICNTSNIYISKVIVQLPPKNKHVKIIGDVTISNKRSTQIEHLRYDNESFSTDFSYSSDSTDSNI